MDVILKKDINKLGYANDIVNVKAGYARNYLIPQGMAIVANEQNRKMLNETLKQKAFKEEKLRNEANDRAKLFEGMEVKIGAKAAATGKIFGSVNTIQIADAIQEQHNIEVNRKAIEIVKADAVKEIGKYKAIINCYKDIKAEIDFEVVAE